MDKYALAAISYLKTRKGVENVAFESKLPVSQLEIANWEDRNLPYELPEDFKSFLRVSNGLLLTWDVNFRGETIQLGGMCLNQLNKIERIELNICPKDDQEEIESFLTGKTSKTPIAAFKIDDQCNCGNVAFVYGSKKDSPEIWFQDLSGKWNFICGSFVQYFRIMIAHLGLPNWQYTFTEFGLDPISKQWFDLIKPERVSLDLNIPKEDPKKKAQAAQAAGTFNGKAKQGKQERHKTTKIEIPYGRPMSARRRKQDDTKKQYKSPYRQIRPRSAAT